jgi:hypothetical protein
MAPVWDRQRRRDFTTGDLDTCAIRKILNDATAEEFAWHPLGHRVAYHSRKDGEWRIWVTAPSS